MFLLLILGCGAPTPDLTRPPDVTRSHERSAPTAEALDDDETRLLATAPARDGAFGTVVVLSDVDADGYTDLIVGGATDTVWAYPGGSSGISAGTEASVVGWDVVTGDGFGLALAAGDVDGDGDGDLVVGAPVAGSSTGAAYAYLGGAWGLDAGTEVKISASDAAAPSGFGIAVAVGDPNGDGYADLAVGADLHTHTVAEQGAVYVYPGSSAGLDAAAEVEIVASAPVTADTFGCAVALDGDLDGDGLDDLVVGGSGAGAVWVYPGSASGPDPAGEQVLRASDGTSGDGFGAAVVHAGDLDGDGYGDLAVGAPFALDAGVATGAVYVYRGAATGPADEQKRVPTGAADGDNSGWALAGGADLDGDGLDDLVVGAPNADGDDDGSGALTVWFGDLDGELRLDGTGGSPLAGLGSTLAVGDLDADGFVDLVGGAPNDDEGDTGAGVVHLWYGDDDFDGDGWATADDCAPTDAAISPDAVEACNGVDDDCDGEVDESGTEWYADADADGYGAGTAVDACTAPEGWVADGTDCDDASAAVHPGAAETDCADPTDYDCDGTGGDADPDGDGVQSCDDCADQDAAVHPGAAEVCDAADLDEDCDGLADDADPDTVTTPWYADTDGDGYGGTTSVSRCDRPTGYVATAGDCDDAVATVNPGATEVCDAADTDEDCDGLADDADAADPATRTRYYTDADGDGSPGTEQSACDLPSGASLVALDCDDTNVAVNPAATEVCDASDVDEDCDGLAEDADPGVDATSEVPFYTDADGDGYAGTPGLACDFPADASAVASDCDDVDAAVNPDAIELCDSLDNDCDGAIDLDDPDVHTATLYADRDEDGWGDEPVVACGPSDTVSLEDGDCDDANPDVHPEAQEVCDDGLTDEDCDGRWDDDDPSVDPDTEVRYRYDDDGDGFPSEASYVGCEAPDGSIECGSASDTGWGACGDADCADENASINPVSQEICDDMDNNCDGVTDATGGCNSESVCERDSGGCSCCTSSYATAMFLFAGALVRRRRDRGVRA